MYEELADLKELYLRCVRCGQCRSVCPVFEEIRNETATPRGKVFLAHMLSSGEIEASKEAVKNLSLCLLCQACTKECPSAIPVHKLVAATRSLLAKKVPSPVRRLMFREIWTRPSLLSLSFRLLHDCQKLGLVGLGVSSGFLPRGLSLPGRLPDQTAGAFIPEVTPAAGKTRLKVGYFLGCSTNFFFPEVALSTVTVLSRLGCEVILPKDLKCCGLPQLDNGEGETVESLMLHNLDAFNKLGVQTVVTDCASCAAALKENSGLKVMDLSGLLIDLAKTYSPGLKKIQKAVTYHDPCHLAKSLGITEGPRELLRLTCAEFREMPDAGNCCGGGGTFAFFNYDVSMGILNKKISSIRETGAEVAATFCPSCIMQLRHGINKNKLDITTVHPVQLLYRSLCLN